jgi:uncharacterized delta-60 repeat protein
MRLSPLLCVLMRRLSWIGACLGMALPIPALFAQSPSVNDGFDPNANGVINAIAVQPNGQIIVGGNFTTLQPNGSTSPVAYNRLARLNINGTVDSTFNPNANGQIYAIVIQPNGQILIGGNFTTLQPNGAATATTRNHIARLNADGSLDTTFNPNATSSLASQVFAIVLQPNGQIVIGGAFTTLQPNGTGTPNTNCPRLARLNADGSVDPNFNPHPNAAVLALALQSNGQIVAGGGFNSITPLGKPGVTRNNVARINADGSLDGGFDPKANGSIDAIAIQADGDILLGGAFTTMQPDGAITPIQVDNLARVTSGGTLDTTFGPSPGANVSSLLIQADGKIILGGSFVQLYTLLSANPASLNHVARLNVDGTVDSTFDPSTNGVVNALALQADGSLLLGGNFTQIFAGSALAVSQRNNLARVNSSGQLDATLNPDNNGVILAMTTQANGQLVLGGTFTSIAGVTSNHLARLNTNGSYDSTFKPVVNGAVTQIVVQPSDTKIIIAGSFTDVNGVARSGLARLNADGSLDTSFNPNPNGVITAVAIQSNNEILVAGAFSSFAPNGSTTTYTLNNVARLNTDGSVDVNFPNLGVDDRVNALVIQPNGQFIIGGEFTFVGTTTTTQMNFIARYNTDGTLDTSFNPNSNNSINCLALQPNGQLLVGGAFTSLEPLNSVGAIIGGATAATPINYLARLNSDGSMDTTFNPDPSNPVSGVAPLANGQILLDGPFVSIDPDGGVGIYPRINFARINYDGSLDQSFIPSPIGSVNALLPLPNGSFYVGGGFTSIAGSIISHLALFNANGTLNTSSAPQANGLTGNTVNAIVMQTDNQVLIAGSFSALAGSTGANVARFAADSTPDATFNANTDGPVNALALLPNGLPIPTQAAGVAWVTATGALKSGFGSDTIAQISGTVTSVVVQPNGQVVLGGNFKNSSGVTGNNLMRLNANGTLDATFNPNPNNIVSAMALQPNGQIIVAGVFTNFTPNGGSTTTTRNYIARLNADGSIDSKFDPNANNPIAAVALQSDGKILIGGNFNVIDPNEATTAYARFNLARLNTDGTVDVNFNPNPAGVVDAIAVQSNGQIIIGGGLVSVQPNGTGNNVTRNGIARINSDGSLDMGFDPEPSGTVNAIVIQSNGQVVLGGSFTALQPYLGTTVVTRNFIARVNTDGSVDTSYDPEANGAVSALALEPNGEILVGGAFSTLQPNGAILPTTRNNLALLTATGAIDASFDPNPNGAINAISLQSDGSVLLGGTFTQLQPKASILIGGSFAHVSNVTVGNLSLLNSDGSPNTALAVTPNGPVNALAVQANSQVVVAGSFSAMGGTPRANLARLNADDSLDTTFNPGVNGAINALAIQSNGQIIVAGAFSSVGGVARTNLARINSTGSTDTAFNATANGAIDAVAVQANGQVLLGGSFSTIDGVARANLARVNSDGTLDTTFNPGANGAVNTLSVLTNGQILVGGSFSTLGGVAESNLGRLNATSTVDATFAVTTDAAVNALAVEDDGKVYLGGLFNYVNGSTRFRFARVGATSGADQYLTVNSGFNTATWTRTGSGPEVTQVDVQLSTDGANWSDLGAASRVGATSNWQISGVSLPGGSIFYLKVLGAAPTSQFGSSGLLQLEQEFDSATGFTGPTVPATSTTSLVSLGGITGGGGTFASSAVLLGSPSASSSAAGAAIAGATGAAGRLITFSSRANVSPQNPIVAGFTIAGPAAKTVLLRAVGPSLSLFGVQAVIENPYLQLYDSTGHLVLANAGWNGDANLAALFNQVGAFPLVAGNADAAAVALLAPGAYTVQVGGANGQTGAALAEVYDADQTASAAQISTLSARSGVDSSHALIGGFVIAGGSSRTVLVRAVGPALAGAGVANPISTPVLSIYDSQGNLLAQNAGWGNPVSVSTAYPAANPAVIAAAAVNVGAAALITGSNDSAVIVDLPPGTYTAQITDANGQTGIALVEVYNLSP